MKLRLNISPCPNDTFMFEALVNRRVDLEGLEFELSMWDIEELNQHAIAGSVDVSKISYAILPLIAGRYNLLDSGSALGRGNGPLWVSRDEELSVDGASVVVPGEHTTANMLMSRLFPQVQSKSYMLFSEIAQAVSKGEFDSGVLIHEGRFTYANKGLKLVADLGLLWEETTSLPLPLGAIVVSGELPQEIQQRVARVVRRSVEYALRNPEVSYEFTRQHAQEMDRQVMKSHINLFVNEYSISLGDEGMRAASYLTGIDINKIIVDGE